MSYEIQEFRDIASYDALPPEIVSGLETCIASAFGGGITQEDARQHMSGQQVLVAQARIDGAYVVKGFSSTSVTSPAEAFGNDGLSTEKGAYFAGAAICSTQQGNGLYHRLNERRFDLALDCGVDYIFTRTQNPRVQEGITSSIERLVDDGSIASYGLHREIIHGAYGRMLTATKPHGRRLMFDDINYERGDAALVAWRFQR